MPTYKKENLKSIAQTSYLSDLEKEVQTKPRASKRKDYIGKPAAGILLRIYQLWLAEWWGSSHLNMGGM